MGIGRVSSKGQKDGTSPETQEEEIRNYCKLHNLQLMEFVPLVESAKDSDMRKDYSKARAKAMRKRWTNLIFFSQDREARNLTDHEKNIKAVKEGKIVLHYAKENRVLHQNSSDSDFTMGSFQAVFHKQLSQTISSKVKTSYETKVKNGNYPMSRPPLGYMQKLERDDRGNPIKGTAKLVPDSNRRRVLQVQREFQLRSEGLTLQGIRKQVIREGLLCSSKARNYHTSSIERRLKNPTYRGDIPYKGKVYPGKHELIIPKHILSEVDRSFGLKSKYKRTVRSGQGQFASGWLKCSCGCHMMYSKIQKNLKSTGEPKQYELYHCTNGKKIHPNLKGMYFPEEHIKKQFSEIVGTLSLPNELLEILVERLNKDPKSDLKAYKRKVETWRDDLLALKAKEDQIYDDLQDGILDREGYQRQIERVRRQYNDTTHCIAEAESNEHTQEVDTAESIQDLLQRAQTLWTTRSPSEQREFLDKILRNPTMDGADLKFDMKEPFIDDSNG